ncbi:Mss4-like protein [Kockovaella imperatae]|uniref:Mss4-like protein n=1 Tax=Kockovaella imperatae TaxID=4999 RepID=A0A1Y1UEG9_9TREE|nr:Mss4-like protein [Kockovaella imperatae]ORX35896.1 Mss4-like protein [Kockovaella imperatae]
MHSGQCLCGATKIEINTTEEKQIACHCTDCQQTSGSAHSTNILPNQKDVKITGDVKEYNSKAASGNTVASLTANSDPTFCGTCGSALAHKSPAFGEGIAVQTGNLPDFRKIPFAAELFVKDRWTGLPEIPGADQAQAMPEA